MSPRCKRPVGTKRTLVFCPQRGGGGGARTDWVMHEYRLLPAGLHLHGCAANAPPPTNVSSHGGDAAADWVVCRIFRRARPAHRARLGGGAREELEEEQAAEESPSSPSSCVTDASETLDQEEDDGDEGSSSSTVASSN